MVSARWPGHPLKGSRRRTARRRRHAHGRTRGDRRPRTSPERAGSHVVNEVLTPPFFLSTVIFAVEMPSSNMARQARSEDRQRFRFSTARRKPYQAFPCTGFPSPSTSKSPGSNVPANGPIMTFERRRLRNTDATSRGCGSAVCHTWPTELPGLGADRDGELQPTRRSACLVVHIAPGPTPTFTMFAPAEMGSATPPASPRCRLRGNIRKCRADLFYRADGGILSGRGRYPTTTSSRRAPQCSGATGRIAVDPHGDTDAESAFPRPRQGSRASREGLSSGEHADGAPSPSMTGATAGSLGGAWSLRLQPSRGSS